MKPSLMTWSLRGPIGFGLTAFAFAATLALGSNVAHSAPGAHEKKEQSSAAPKGTILLSNEGAAGKTIPMPPVVEVGLHWTYRNFQLKARYYELSQQTIDRLGETRNAKSIGHLPVIREITDNKVSVPAMSYKMILMAVENPTSQPVYFFASPHVTSPVIEGIGVKFICLCNGSTYRVRPHMTWYRVMQLKTTRANRSPSFELAHEVIGLDPKDVVAPTDEIN